MFVLLAAADLDPGYGTLIALCIFIAASVWLGTLAQKVVRGSSFVKGYFLGNRGLGAWAVALTATVQSGGTFMGFPSLVYSHGWIVALWIGSYMVVPITGFGLIGKRVAHLSRATGAITMPDLFRLRFASPALGLVTSLLIIVFLSSMLVAQFKAGATVMKLAWPGSGILALSEEPTVAPSAPAVPTAGLRGLFANVDRAYLLGLVIFSITVVGYTLIGGFLAAVWTDLFQSVMMFIGVLLLLGMALYATGGLEAATRKAVENAEIAGAAAVEASRQAVEKAEVAGEKAIAAAREKGEYDRLARLEADPPRGLDYVSGPGYSKDGRDFLPLSLAISFFIFWPATGFASPASVTRIMACKDTLTLRKSIVLLCVYNLGIYLPLICICICARALLPDLASSDEVVPRMAIRLSQEYFGKILGSLASGLILAAPFGAIMATVSTYLVVIASGIVRDVYQRFIKPDATEHEMRRLSQWGMIAVGVFAVLLNIWPVTYLQALVVFSSGGAGASFIVPTIMLCYWRRATAPGVIAAMLTGAATMLVLYLTGFSLADPLIGQATQLRPYFMLGLEPLLWGVTASAIVGVVVSLNTEPPSEKLMHQLFVAPPLPAGEAP